MNTSDKTPLSDKIIDIYERRARDFDADRGRTLFEKPWLDKFVALLPKNASVLDIGCGSGKPIAQYLIEDGLNVSGVDSSTAMISLCRERFPKNSWTVADMRTLNLGQKFAGLLAWNSFFHLTRDAQRQMFPIFRKHAKPGAALMFTSGPYDGEELGALRDETLFHASLDPSEYRTLLSANKFRVVDYVPEDPACRMHTIWLAQKTA